MATAQRARRPSELHQPHVMHHAQHQQQQQQQHMPPYQQQHQQQANIQLQQQQAAPTALTGYEPLDIIGNGTFGIIRKVRRLADNRLFARKELNFERMSERDRKQIVAEVNILRTLGHDNIVKYEERFVDKDRGILYIVMEYCEGGDLGSVIKRFRRTDRYLQEETVWCYLAQMTRALDACHYRGVPYDPPSQPDDCSPLAHAVQVNPASFSDATAAITAAAAAATGSPHQSGLAILHRDLKPENVFLDALGNIKLGDFGLSKQVGTAELARTYVGTPYYMSPELATGGPYDAKSDIWALGCIAFELCALRPPFDAANQAELTIKIKAGEVPHLPPQYSPELGKVVRAMLSLNPRHRPTTRQLLQVYQIQLCLKHLDVNSMARSLTLEREQMRHTQAQLEAAEAELQRREAALHATPSNIAESDRQRFAAQLAELEARESALAERTTHLEAREAKVLADEVDAEKRRAELEKKYIDWYEGERKRAEEVLQENREREEEIRARRESRERARAARKSVATSSSVGEQTTSVGRSGRGSGASEGTSLTRLSEQDGSEEQQTAEGATARDADSNVTTRSRRPPRVAAMRVAADITGAGPAEMSYITTSRYMNTTAAGTSMVLPTSASARNFRPAPSSNNVLPARRVVSGPRQSRVSVAPNTSTMVGEHTTAQNPNQTQNASVMMMDIDTSALTGPSAHNTSHSHLLLHHHHHPLHVRERLFGGHPVGSPRSALRADTSARLFRGVGGSRPSAAVAGVPASRLGGLLGAGGDEVVVEMDRSPAPQPPASRVVKASRVSRAAAVHRSEENGTVVEEQDGVDAEVALPSDGGSDEWIDQDGPDSGGSAKTSMSPSRVAAAAAADPDPSAARTRYAFGDKAPGVNLEKWRGAGRGDAMDLEDDSAETDGDDDEQQQQHRLPLGGGGGGGAHRAGRRTFAAAPSSGFDSDVAMESPIAVKVRQAYRRSLAAGAAIAPAAPVSAGAQKPAEAVSGSAPSSSPRQHSSGSADSPGRRLQQQFGRLQLEDGYQHGQAQAHTTPPMPLPASSATDADDNPMGPPLTAAAAAPARRVRTSTGPVRVAGSSDGPAASSSSGAAFGDDEDDLPSPFIKRVSRVDSPANGSSDVSAAGGQHSSSGSGLPSSKSILAAVSAGNTSTFPIRSSSAHNLLAKAVAGSAAAAYKAAEEQRSKAAAAAAAAAVPQSAAIDERNKRAEIENQRPAHASIYPNLPSSTLGGGSSAAERSTSALQAIRARRQSAAPGVGVGGAGGLNGMAGTARGAAALSSARPSAGVARRLSTAGGGVAGGAAGAAAPATRVLANGSAVAGKAGRTSIKPAATAAAGSSAAAAGGPAGRITATTSSSGAGGLANASFTGAAALGPPSVPLGGANVLIPGASRRRSMMFKREP